MSTQNAVVVRDEAGIVGYYIVVEASVSTGDNFKVSQLSTITNVVALQVSSSWASVSCTFAGNIVTVTQAGLSAVRIVALVGGQK
jgi:hypothetical protein